jgi:cation transport ATPase
MSPGGTSRPLFIPNNSHTAGVAALGIAVHLLLRYGLGATREAYLVPLYLTLLLGGVPLVLEIAWKLRKGDFGADLVAGISIVTSAVLGQYLAGSLVVLMLAGGQALEAYALGRASDVLHALAKRMPSRAHRRRGSELTDVPLEDVSVGDLVVLFPHDICPVDGVVVEGNGTMDESYLTGEPFLSSKAPGAGVLSGAINGDSAITIRAERRAVDSRYAKIMEVMRDTQQKRPTLRRLGDLLGMFYPPVAVGIAVVSLVITGNAVRFLSVLVIATPCPLIIAIPVAIIGSISLAAKRSIIIKNPAILEQIATCRTIIFDKTGTLTYGKPTLTEQICAPGLSSGEILTLAASLEQYSRHPLSAPILEAARRSGLGLTEASQMSERPGEGLRGVVCGRRVCGTGRDSLEKGSVDSQPSLPLASQRS